MNLKNIFTREDEYDSEITDIHQRNLSLYSPFPCEFPLLSEYLLKNNKICITYPENKKFAVCLTHDIDELYIRKKYIWKQIIKDSAQIKFKQLPLNFSILANKKLNPFYNIDNILEIENQLHVNSTFFFLALTKGEQDYNYNSHEVRSLFQSIKQNKSEIGLHAGHEAYFNYNKLSEEKKRLEDFSGIQINGLRNHFLKFRNPDSWEISSKSGFKYDTTYGYHNTIGFRNGLCYPFNPYNLKKNNYIDIVEFPLTIMDCVFDRHFHLDINNSFKTIKKIIDIVKQFNGVLTLLWHNTYFVGEYKNLYKLIIEYCKTENAWLTSCENIYSWWIENNIKTQFFEDLDD
jgi:peptidoglycan/xylan/chitin deacetylase (PgdA/CDA1 family)